MIKEYPVEIDFDCIIVGAGISGMTAAIYLKRYGYNIALIEKNAPGGQMNQISTIENYPGYTSVDGVTLSINTYHQIQDLNIKCIFDSVISIENQDEVKLVKTTSAEYRANTIIISTGREKKMLGLPNEQWLIGKGISYCATCDGPFFKNEEVCVVGGGNSALEEAIYLSKICKKVTIINRTDKLKADDIFKEQIKDIENIQLLYNSVVNTLNEENSQLSSVTLSDGTIVPCKGLFIYIGLETNLSYLTNLEIKIENKSIVVDKNMKTNIDGVYACGDCIQKDLYQLVTATAEGAIAATSVKKYLQTKGY